MRRFRRLTDFPHLALAGLGLAGLALAGLFVLLLFVLQALFLPAPSAAATVAGLDGGADVPSLAEGSTAPCIEDEQTLCLAQGRFEVRVDWTDFDANDGSGQTVSLPSDSSGLFYFFDSSNIEMLVKVLDGFILNDRFWVFFAATTTVRFTLSVRDTETGMVKGYVNPLGNAADAVTDTSAFATCDGTPEPRELVLDAEEQNRASADLPVQGGSITATAADGTVYSLTFPPGALNQPETISLTPAAASTDSLDEVLAAVLLEPSGLQLLEPARLEIELTPGADLGGELAGFRANGDGSGFFLTGAVTDGLSASLDIPHFSAAGVGRVDDPFSAFCPFELLEASLPAANLARLRLVFLTNALTAGCVNDDPLVAGQIVADIFKEWYLQTVLPATQEAAQDPEASIRHALGTANEWLAVLNTDPLAQKFRAQDGLRLPFDCPQGICSSLGEAADRTAEFLLESLRLAVAQADSRCRAEGLNDDRATLEWIDLGNVLVTQGQPQFQDAEVLWRLPPTLLDITTCGLRELRWQVGESSGSENPSAFLLPGVREDIEIIGHDGSGREIRLDPLINAFHEIKLLVTVSGVGASPNLQVGKTFNFLAQVTPCEGGDAEISARTFFPRSGEIILNFPLQVRSIDLNGRWLIESLSTDNDCEPPAPVPPDELATVGQDSTIMTVRLDDSFDKPLRGPLVHDRLDQPFEFELGPESSTTAAFCERFNEDVCDAIGVCEPEDDAVPLFCRETQRVRGSIDESGDRATADSGFRVELSYDVLPGGSIEDAVLVTESCEGTNKIVATRQ